MRFWTAIRAFFRTLTSVQTAQEVKRLLDGPSALRPAEPPAAPATAPLSPKGSARSEALTLLAALQREARFVDFLQESLDGYSDQQIGAAARDVHRDCAKVVARMFALAPVLAEEEGASVDVPSETAPACYRLTGDVSGERPLRGTVVHHGWKATRCELPSWSGSKAAAMVVAPAEVEVR